MKGVDEVEEVDLEKFDWQSFISHFGSENVIDQSDPDILIPALSNEWLTEKETNEKESLL